MLIDQIQILTNYGPGLIEKIIYQIQVFASMGGHCWKVINSDKENIKKIINCFTKEGFTVETFDYDENDKFFPNTTEITISW